MSSKLPITVLVQTKNEELGISECIAGLHDFDEVIVVDSISTDRTKEISLSLGVEVADFEWDGRYPKKKQWQLDNLKTRHDWILFMDADETPSPELIDELRSIFAFARVESDAFDIDLDYVFAGQLLKHGHRVTKRCLLRRGAAKFPVMNDLGIPGMGELEGHYQPTVEGKVTHLKSRIVHNDLDPVSSWFTRHNRYSDWEAHLRTRADAREDVRKARTMKGRLFDAVPFKPLIFFLYAYVARAGFLDGRPGFDYAFALSAYYWQIGLKVREIRAGRGGA